MLYKPYKLYWHSPKELLSDNNYDYDKIIDAGSHFAKSKPSEISKGGPVSQHLSICRTDL